MFAGPHRIRDEARVRPILVWLEPKERGIAVDMDEQTVIAAVREDKRSVRPASYRPQHIEEFVLTLNMLATLEAPYLHSNPNPIRRTPPFSQWRQVKFLKVKTADPLLSCN